jgi:hypothetical protein
MAANLKIDLKNKLLNDKFYEELELVRLAGDPNANYKGKIDAMQYQLERLAILNSEIGLVDQYFQDQPPVQQVPVAGVPVQGQPVSQPHPGQTFGE